LLCERGAESSNAGLVESYSNDGVLPSCADGLSTPSPIAGEGKGVGRYLEASEAAEKEEFVEPLREEEVETDVEAPEEQEE
jgi:hypothetical protein